ncbi:MAG: hypothetical protein ABI411_11215 [Tahibacter sp.]
MKIRSIVAITALFCVSGGPVLAQSCASPSVIPLVGSTHIATGDTCAGANQLGTLCGAFSSPENDIIYRFNIDATRVGTSFTLSTSTGTWNPAMLYLSGSCGGGVSCTDVADNNGAGASETMSVPTALGAYYLVITSSPGTGGCGAFTVQANGRLPVALQHFSVE